MLKKLFKIRILFAITFQLTGGRALFMFQLVKLSSKMLLFSPPCRMFTPILADFYKVKFEKEFASNFVCH